MWAARIVPLPASAGNIAAFVADERDRGRAGNTIRLRVAAIRYLHRAAGFPSPTGDVEVTETIAGVQRDAPNPRKKRAATLTLLRELLAPIPADLRGLRDRALLLVGFAGALRRSELTGIAMSDLELTDRGYQLTLPRSKGAQTSAVMVPIPYGRTELCPVRALTHWIVAANIIEGAVFRRVWTPLGSARGAPSTLFITGTEAISPRSIARIVQARAEAAGFVGKEFGGHSLKRGALTTGMDAGAHPTQLRRLGRHATFNTLGEYLEFGNLSDGHPLGPLL